MTSTKIIAEEWQETEEDEKQKKIDKNSLIAGLKRKSAIVMANAWP
jgi:hypothetical protein